MIFRIPKIKLGNKIALIYFILGFASLIAVNLIWLLPSLTETRKNAATLQLEIAKRGATDINSFLDYKLGLLEKISLFLKPQEIEKNRESLDNFLQKEQAFFEMTLIDGTGQEQIKVSQFEIFSESELISRSDEEYFQKALGGVSFVSRVFFSEKAEPYLILAIPIYFSPSGTGGILMAKLKLREIWQIISELKVGSLSHSFVVDGEGRLIADPNPSLVLKNLNLSDLAPVKKIIEKKQIVDGLAPEDIYKNDQGQSVLAVGVPLQKLNWGLIIERPETDAYSALTNKIIAFVLIFVLGGLLIFFVARLLATYLIGPMKKLRDGAKIIGAGNLDYRLNITSGDEIQELAEALNEMGSQLKESYVYLEHKVDERTRELTAQRDQLDQAAKKLIDRDVVLNEIRKQQEKALVEANEAKSKSEEARIASLNILEDIEQSREAQEDEKNKVEAVLRSLTDGLIMIDQFGWISLINPEAELMLNVKKENVLLKRLAEIEKTDIKKINEAIEKEEGVEKKEIKLEGSPERILEISTAPVVGVDKKILGQVIILHDITREKAIEKMKTEFVTIAAHQLRTPLSAVKWTLRLILDQDLGPISKEQAETLEKGYQSNERMIRLVNDLLNITRIEEGRFIYGLLKISFIDLIKETVDNFQTLAEMRHIKIKLQIPENDIEIMGDKEKMKLALQNLIENAISYSLSGNDVTISVDCDNMNLTVAIKDKGMGIQKNQQVRVFSKFFRGDNAVKMETEGSGLGLFLTKNIIERHGGKIWFESEEGKGSTFYFTLPLAK
jgi:PAS domain S-box-containing protein